MLNNSSFKNLIGNLDSEGKVIHVSDPTDPAIEVCAAAAKHLGTTMLFENLKGFPGFKGVTEVLKSEQVFEQIYNMDYISFLNHVSQAVACPIPCVEAEKPIWVNKKDSLKDLPIPRYFENDGGLYIAGGMLILNYPGSTACNISFNRLMVVDDSHLAFNIHKGKHTDLLCNDAEKKGERIPAAIIIGAEPSVMVAAASPAPWGTDELDVASAIKTSPISVMSWNGIKIPADAEIVIMGYVENEKVPEGPFVDYLGVMHGQGKGRLFSVDSIYCADDPVFHALMPGASKEHLQLMAVPVEAEIAQRLRKLTRFKDVTLTRESGLFHAVISIDKSTDGEAKTALMATLSSYPFIKHAVVVDADVDIRDSAAVEKAIALCVQADKDVIVVPGLKATMVDPRTAPDMLGAKMGIDATRPVSSDKEKYEPIPWPEI